MRCAAVGFVVAALAVATGTPAQERIVAELTFAPEVPRSVSRRAPAVVEVHLRTSVVVKDVAPGTPYEFWTFEGHVPGPFIRARIGDLLEVHLVNGDTRTLAHNIDLHAVTGPGGGALVTTAMPGEEKVGTFQLLHPGLFVYHCAATPVAAHIANGMYGLILVEPRRSLPPAAREFYVMQSEVYADPAGGGGPLPFSYLDGLAEHPRFVVFNGATDALTGTHALQAQTGERMRVYFGNAGPNLISSFHLIGEIFDRVYREGDLVSRPARSVQSTLVPAGGATVVDVVLDVPGTYTLVDHAIFRTLKGALGTLVVTGAPRPDIYDGVPSASGHEH